MRDREFYLSDRIGHKEPDSEGVREGSQGWVLGGGAKGASLDRTVSTT